MTKILIHMLDTGIREFLIDEFIVSPHGYSRESEAVGCEIHAVASEVCFPVI